MLALYHIQPVMWTRRSYQCGSRPDQPYARSPGEDDQRPLMEVGPGLKSGVRIRMDNPAQLGGELLCAAVGALQTHKPPLLVMNMDTAATLVAVDAEGSIVGGVILPARR